jgi:hypothetical protein
MLDLHKLHELSKQLLMHLVPYFIPDSPIFSQIFKTEYFFSLKLIQILIDKWPFDYIFLPFIFILMVIVLDMLAFFVVVVVKVPHSMGVLAFFAAVDTKSS